MLPNNRPDIRSLFESVIPYFNAGEKPSDDVLKLKMVEGIYVLLNTDINLYASLFDFVEPWKIDILDYLNENYMFDLSMNEIASYTGRSLATFKRDFAKVSDLTPQKWIIKRRLEAAHDLIKSGKKKVTEACFDVGFKNLSHFAEEVASTIADLIKEGKVQRWGMCEVSAETIRKAHAICPLTAIQSEYHLMHRLVEENGVLDVCRELGIGFVPYSPINRGFLGGCINEYTVFDPNNDNRQTLPRFQPEAMRANTRIVNVLQAFGRTRGMTSSQVVTSSAGHPESYHILFSTRKTDEYQHVGYGAMLHFPCYRQAHRVSTGISI